jgi:hypothetical protein
VKKQLKYQAGGSVSDDDAPAVSRDFRRERMSESERNAEDAEAARRQKAASRRVERFAYQPTGIGRLMEGIFGSEARSGGPKRMANGGIVKSSASSRADGCAARGKTKGRMV